jgi:hypothetical protein
MYFAVTVLPADSGLSQDSYYIERTTVPFQETRRVDQCGVLVNLLPSILLTDAINIRCILSVATNVQGTELGA